MARKKAPKPLDPADVIAARRASLGVRQGYVSLLLRVLFIALAAWLLLSQVFMLTQIKGQGMFPAVKDGDLAIAFRLQSDIQKGDVVIYTRDGASYIGRIAARGGDVVNINEAGTLTVNGTVQSGEIMYPTYAKEAVLYPFTVPDGSYFILGDYRTQTTDSRDFGPVSADAVDAKVITILRRRSL